MLGITHDISVVSFTAFWRDVCQGEGRRRSHSQRIYDVCFLEQVNDVEIDSCISKISRRASGWVGVPEGSGMFMLLW